MLLVPRVIVYESGICHALEDEHTVAYTRTCTTQHAAYLVCGLTCSRDALWMGTYPDRNIWHVCHSFAANGSCWRLLRVAQITLRRNVVIVSMYLGVSWFLSGLRLLSPIGTFVDPQCGGHMPTTRD